MRTKIDIKSLITLTAASLAVGILIVLPIIVGAQPDQSPTGGNIDAEFDTVSATKYFDLDDANYFLDPSSGSGSLNAAGAIATEGDVLAGEDIFLDGSINSGNPLGAVVVNDNLAMAGYLFSYNPGTPVRVYDDDGFQIGSSTGVDSLFVSADGVISNATGMVRINDMDGVAITGGNVGIGTTAPSSMLNIVTGIGNSLLRLEGSGVGGGGLFFTYRGFMDGYEIRSDDFGGLNIEASGWNKISFDTNSSEKMRIAPNGNVGIGETNPKEKLDIDVGTDAGIGFTSSLHGDQLSAKINYEHAGTWKSGELNFGINQGMAAPVDVLTIDGNANVGIGTTAPTTKLEVMGDIKTSADIMFPAIQSTTSSGVIYKATARFLHNYGGNYNTFLGVYAGNLTTTSSGNTGIGGLALTSLTTGSNNTAMGVSSLSSNTTGYDNVAMGNGSLNMNRDGYRNVAVGTYSLNKNISGNQNVAIGYSAMNLGTSGVSNTAVGNDSAYSITSGSNNTAIGMGALRTNSTGSENTAIGKDALYNNKSTSNVALGYQAGYRNSGSGNIFIGYQAGWGESGSNTLYIDNSDTDKPLIHGDFDANIVAVNGILGAVVPADGVFSNFGGYGIGVMAIGNEGGGVLEDGNSTGVAHIASNDVGISAYGSSHGGYFADNVLLPSANGSAYIGGRDSEARYYGIRAFGDNYAGYFENNSYSGYAYLADGHTGIFAYGNLQGGWFEDTNSGGIYARVGRGSYGIYSNGYLYGMTGASSDRRLKKNIVPLPNSLNRVMELEPVEFEYKASDSIPGKQLGFIAQDAEKIVPELIIAPDLDVCDLTEDEINDTSTSLQEKCPEAYYGFKYGQMSPLLTKAVQELKAEKDNEIAELKEEVAESEKKVAALQSVVCELKPEADICNQ